MKDAKLSGFQNFNTSGIHGNIKKVVRVQALSQEDQNE
jgi:hypothetical protein